MKRGNPRLASRRRSHRILLDTFDLKDRTFQSWLARHGVVATIHRKVGPGGGSPVVRYVGSKTALTRMVDQCFGDWELSQFIKAVK